ncbi:MAG: EtfB protein, partial [Myxococcota bacterium]
MKILTTVKKVNNPDAKVNISGDNTEMLVDDGEKKLNDFDEWGVEEAIRLKEEHGGEVVVVSVGGSDAEKEIRTAMAMGADRGILVEVDPSEVDSGVVAKLLAAVVEREEPDLVT